MQNLAFLREALLQRRALLSGLAGGAAAAATQRSLAMPRPDLDPAADLAAAARLYGLDFDAEELALCGRRIRNLGRNLQSLREADLDWWTAPAVRFDPLPGGVEAPGPKASESPRFAEPGKPADDLDLSYASVTELGALLRAGKTSARKLCEHFLGRLKNHDKQLLCVVNLLEAQALAAADRADAEIRAGKWRGPLHGIPYGAKDLLAWPGAPTTFGAAPFQEQRFELKASSLQQLEEAGAILVAKLSLGALAMGDVWFKGRTRNPHNPRQGSSGSSAGPAAAVAAGLLPFAIGSETCGSIVSPCSRCGVSGLRPTFGRVSRHGAMPLSWTMDKLGPIARNALDLALVFDAIRKLDPRDAMPRDAGFRWPLEKRPLRVGLVEGRVDYGRGANHGFVSFLRAQGHKLSGCRFPDLPYSALMQILSTEAATAMDDLTRSPGIDKLSRQDAGAWPTTFRAAQFVPAVGHLRASRLRSRLLAQMHELMTGFDVLVAPRGGTDNLYATNLSGHPSVVFPVGPARPGRAPQSLTIIGRLYEDDLLLDLLQRWQGATEFHQSKPIA